MKAVFIAFDQAFRERLLAVLDHQNCRGFSLFPEVQGRGSVAGEPHMGSHAWPAQCSAVLTVVDDSRVEPLLDAVRTLDHESPLLGIRAFVWNVEQTV